MENISMEFGKVIGSLNETNKRLDGIESDIQELKLCQVKIQAWEDNKINETEYIRDIQEIKHKIVSIDTKVDTLYEIGKNRDEEIETIDKKYSGRLDTLERAKGEEALETRKYIKDKLMDKIINGIISAIIISIPLILTGAVGQ